MKIVTITGNSGSGKTVFSHFLSVALASKHNKVVLVHTDAALPTAKLLNPSRVKNDGRSLGKVLSSPVVTPALLTDNIIISGESKNLGILSYAQNESQSTYPEVTNFNIVAFLKALAMIADYVVFDTTGNILPLDRFVEETNDVHINVVSADFRGIAYYSTASHINTDVNILNQNNVKNMPHEVSRVIGISDIQVLPFEKGLMDLYNSSDIGEIAVHDKYVRVVKGIANSIVGNDHSEQEPDESVDECNYPDEELEEDEYDE